MTKTVLDDWRADEPAPQGGTFLERALERALSTLDRDVELSEAEREAAKAALAAALTREIRDVLAGAVSPLKRAPARAAGPAGPFAAHPGVARPGYFHEPAAVIGISETAGDDVRLTGGAATWMRLMPAADPGKAWSAAALRAAMRKGGGVLPIFADARGTSELRADGGFGIYAMSPSATETSGVVFAFHSGEIWSLDTYVQDALAQQRPNRTILTLEPELTAAFASYVDLLQRLGVRGPYRWVVGMDGLLGRSMALPDGEMAGLVRGDCLVNTVVSEGVYDGAGPIEQAIQPFFEDLCKACTTPVG